MSGKCMRNKALTSVNAERVCLLLPACLKLLADLSPHSFTLRSKLAPKLLILL